jgi:hypothetical protein
MTGGLTAAPHLRRWSGDSVAVDFDDFGEPDQKTAENGGNLRQKRHSQRAAMRDKHLSSGTVVNFDDNAIN